MHDERFSRDWVENHQAFSDSLDRGLKRLGARFHSLLSWDGTAGHFAALILSAAVTTLTFNGTAA